MTKRFQYFALLFALLVLLLSGCSGNHATNPQKQTVAAKVTLLKTSLAQSIVRVTLQVVQSDIIVHLDTALIVDGAFSFPTFDLDAGSATFTVDGLDAENRVIYEGSTTANILPGVENQVTLQLIPEVPMVKLSDYYQSAITGSLVVSKLELYDIARFRNGTFQITYDPELMRFDSLKWANNSWGQLQYSYTTSLNRVDVTVLRTSASDLRPTNAHELIDLQFTALAPGNVQLDVAVGNINDDSGPIIEITNETLQTDGQTIAITQLTGSGTISGIVTGASNDLPLLGVNVLLTGPVQRSTVTASDGAFSFSQLPYGTYLLTATLDGYINAARYVTLTQPTYIQNLVLSSQLDTGSYRIVLTWSASPHDLDAHLWTLGDEVYFASRGSLDSLPFAYLDVDEQNGYGPETITITSLRDTCKYAVYNYSESPDITTSQAHVDFYHGSALIGSYDVPNTGTGLWWYVFDLTPSGEVITHDVITDTSPGPQLSPRPNKRTAFPQ